jgi:hypothetical protein
MLTLCLGTEVLLNSGYIFCNLCMWTRIRMLPLAVAMAG